MSFQSYKLGKVSEKFAPSCKAATAATYPPFLKSVIQNANYSLPSFTEK